MSGMRKVLAPDVPEPDLPLTLSCFRCDCGNRMRWRGLLLYCTERTPTQQVHHLLHDALKKEETHG